MRAMRRGTLNMRAASLQATRLVSSDWVTAISRSASSMPASVSTEGGEELPVTVRRSKRSGSARRRPPSTSTTVMSFCSETRLSATELPTWPAPRMTIFTPQPLLGKSVAFYSDSPFLAPPHRQAEGFQLAVQVRAFQAAFLGHARHAAARRGQQVLEIDALESLARLAVRP